MSSLESDIREALRAQAATLEVSDALARLGAVAYHPRRVNLARRLSLGAVAGSATAGGVVAVVLLGGAQPAFAGWSADPTTPSPAQSATAGTSCQSGLATSPVTEQAGTGSWQPLVTDVRGPFTVATYENNGVFATCFTGPNFTVVNATSADGTANSMSVSASSSGQSNGTLGGQSSAMVTVLSGGDIERLTETHLVSSADGAYTLVDGQVSSAVTGVTLVEADGTSVVATVANGWILAWWPADAAVASATVTTANGTTDQSLTRLPGPGAAPGATAPCAGESGAPTACSGSGSTSN